MAIRGEHAMKGSEGSELKPLKNDIVLEVLQDI